APSSRATTPRPSDRRCAAPCSTLPTTIPGSTSPPPASGRARWPARWRRWAGRRFSMAARPSPPGRRVSASACSSIEGGRMALNVAIQMDPVEAINIETDTTFLLMMEAQARGHRLWVYTPERIALEEGAVTARGRTLTLQPVKGDHHRLGAFEVRDLA